MKDEELDIDTSDLPQLTEKQYNFVVGLSKGMNASDAYRKAYPNNAYTDRVIWTEASRLRSNPKVVLWIVFQ